MVGSSSWNDQINLPPPRKLVRPQHWFTITLSMNEFFEVESLSSESITISSHKICALYFYMCMSTYNTLWKLLSMLHRLHQKGRGATQRTFLLYKFVPRKWQQWREPITSTAMIHNGGKFCFKRSNVACHDQTACSDAWLKPWFPYQ